MHFDNTGNFQISRDEILQLIGCAFTKTLQRDAVLFGMKNQVQERCLMHRFACELRALLKFAEDFRWEGQPVMSLDVEYNRAGEGLKTPKGVEQDWIAVDILFHERKSAEKDCRNDILCCEMKKTGEEEGADRRKVLCIMRQYKYQFGIDFFRFSRRPYLFELFEDSTRGIISRGIYAYDGLAQSFRYERAGNPIPPEFQVF